MVPRKSHAGLKKAAHGTNHDEEWVPSISSETALNSLVEHGVLPDKAIGAWRSTVGEPFPMLHTDELVVFEDYFFHGFGVPIHPFLHGLIVYYGINLCNLNPNSILHASIFMNFCNCTWGSSPISICFATSSTTKSKGGVALRWSVVLICSCMMG
jgi:hypothetical protein